jgi:hypothetical protein
VLDVRWYAFFVMIDENSSSFIDDDSIRAQRIHYCAPGLTAVYGAVKSSAAEGCNVGVPERGGENFSGTVGHNIRYRETEPGGPPGSSLVG